MPKENERIAESIEKELRRNPKASTAELQEKAAKIKRSVAKMSLRSFHSTHVGAIKRRISGKKGGRKSSARAKASRIGSTKSDLRATINSVVEAEIRKARDSFNTSLDRALEKARRSGTTRGFEKIHEVLLKAKGMF